MSDTDRLARAGNYVFGLMDEAERERAERDLERDASFREAVIELAERVRLSKIRANPHAWDAVSAALSALPQMQPRNGEPKPPTLAKAANQPAPPLPALLDRMGRRDALQIGLILAGLIAAFTLGYLVGISR
jgi:anti-sigma factor RsiW